MADEPIVPQDYLFGVKVVDIGDIRVARGMTRRPASSCDHHRLVYDTNERRVWCSDCEQDVDAFDAFQQIVGQFASASAQIKRREEELAAFEALEIRSLAAKTLDKAWRSRSMVPSCPHCKNGLMPEDFKSRPAMISREYAEARLGRSHKTDQVGSLIEVKRD